jgi:hypothetical protein
LTVGGIGVLGDEQEASAEEKVEESDRGVDEGDQGDGAPLHPEDGAGEDVLDVLRAMGGLVYEDDGGAGGEGVYEADDGLLRDAAFPGAGKGEDGGGDGGEGHGEPV